MVLNILIKKIDYDKNILKQLLLFLHRLALKPENFKVNKKLQRIDKGMIDTKNSQWYNLF